MHSCHQLENVPSWNITALCESTNLISLKHCTKTPVQIVGEFVITKSLVIVSLFTTAVFRVTLPYFKIKNYQISEVLVPSDITPSKNLTFTSCKPDSVFHFITENLIFQVYA